MYDVSYNWIEEFEDFLNEQESEIQRFSDRIGETIGEGNYRLLPADSEE